MSRLTALIGIVTISDRVSGGVAEDRSGPAIERYLAEVLTSPFETERRLIADETEQIEAAIVELADSQSCDLILTTGGTGPAPRDVTPEATAKVCDKLLPGFGEEMRRVSMAEVPTAILSRQTAGIRGGSLVLNLPGNPRAVRTCLDAVFAAIPDCVDLIGGARLETDPERVRTYRPH